MQPPELEAVIPSLPWVCKFETPTGETSECDFSQDDSFEMQWALTSGPTPSEGTGPDTSDGERGIVV